MEAGGDIKLRKPLHILMVEDSEDDTKLVMEELKERGYDPIYQRVETPDETKTALRQCPWDVVLSDYVMPRFSALEAMRLVKDAGLDIPFIIITGSIGEEIAVAAMKAGAHDYMMKDNLSRLSPAIEREMEEAAHRRDHRKAQRALQQSEERFRQLAESIQEVFWMKDSEKNKMIYVSPSYEKIWGRSRLSLYEDLESLIQSIHPDDRSHVIDALAKVPFQAYDLEYRIIHSNGSVRWIRDRAFPIRNEKEEIYRISGIAEDMTERKLANDELKSSRAQLRDLASRLDSVREMERAWISREIHDELGQIFTSLKYDLSLLQNGVSKMESAREEEKSRLEERIKSASDLIGIAIKTVQKIAMELRPGILDDLGLMAALEWQGSEFQKRTGIVCRLHSDLRNIRLDGERATAVFRIFQEILTNVARHAGAKQVKIRIREKTGHLLLNVKDNGRGITEEERSNPKSLGILGMHERALLIGGKIQISGVPQKGTEVSLQIPLKETKEERKEEPPSFGGKH
jgi:two-component system, NarL family, sensor histidine kinase UhpB